MSKVTHKAFVIVQRIEKGSGNGALFLVALCRCLKA
jgi:hypothetical protein